MALVLFPKVTAAGKAAALSATNDGLELAITHISFGQGAPYNPTGSESALVDEVIHLPVGSGARITPTQIRLATVWQAALGTYPITEVGIWAGPILFAVWSSTVNTPLGYKSPGIDYVFFYDMALDDLPANALTVTVDSDLSAFLTALGVHTSDLNAHPYYLRRDKVAQDGSRLYYAGVATGTANDLVLTLPVESLFTSYVAGQRIAFKAASDNLGAVTANVAGVGAIAVKKNATEALFSGDIKAGAIYELVYDGTNFQIAGGVGGTGTGEGALVIHGETWGAAQTEITGLEYTVGSVVVTRNGWTLDTTDFVASDGTTVQIPGAVEGDEILVLMFRTFRLADHYTKAEVDAVVGTALIPLGAVLPFAMNAVPEGWLKCDGSLVLRTTYAALFAKIGTTYNTGGEPSTHFRLPDARAEFIRGFDDGRGVDAGRVFGSNQSQAGGLSSVQTAIGTENEVPATVSVPQDGTASAYMTTGDAASAANQKMRFTNSATLRPRNIAMLYCIKAFDAVLNPSYIDVAALAALLVIASETTYGFMQVATREEVKTKAAGSLALTPSNLEGYRLIPKAVWSSRYNAIENDMGGNVTFVSFSQNIVTNQIRMRFTFTGLPALTLTNLTLLATAPYCSQGAVYLINSTTLDIVFDYWNNGLGAGVGSGWTATFHLHCKD